MARIGSNIQAGLGRIDYSPLFQGMSNAQQFAAQGNAALAQSIAGIGNIAGTSISNYFKRKEEENRLNKDVDALKTISSNPGTKATFEQLNIFKPDGSFDDATAKSILRERGLAGTVTLANSLRDLERQAKMETTNKKAIEYSSLLEIGGGKLPSPYSNDFVNKSFTPEEKALGKDIYIKQATAQANLDKARRELVDGAEAPTTAMRDADAIIANEISAGMLPRNPMAIASRRAELIAAGGREPAAAYDNAGTYVLRSNQTNPVTAVKDRKTGRIGVVNEQGKFEPLDSKTYMPITTSDANPFLNEENFKKLSDQLVEQENGIKSVNRFLKNTENISTGGIQRSLDKLSLNVKSIMGLKESDLSEAEKAIGLAGSQQQRLLGALRTTILGPGVLTEIDAQRILNAVGGDVNALTTNVDLMRELVSEILQEKVSAYEQNLDIYNTQVAGRYGRAGYRQRNRIEPVSIQQAAQMPANQPRVLNVRPAGK
jgi:hypothetical protein